MLMALNTIGGAVVSGVNAPSDRTLLAVTSSDLYSGRCRADLTLNPIWLTNLRIAPALKT
jgi:hypothetical protein